MHVEGERISSKTRAIDKKAMPASINMKKKERTSEDLEEVNTIQ